MRCCERHAEAGGGAFGKGPPIQPGGCSAGPGVGLVSAAPNDVVWTLLVARIDLLVCTVKASSVRTPFPGVSGHIEDSQPVGRKDAHRGRLFALDPLFQKYAREPPGTASIDGGWRWLAARFFAGFRRSLSYLESFHPGLPQDEREHVGIFFLSLPLRRPDPMPRFIIQSQQDRLPTGAGGLEAGCGLR